MSENSTSNTAQSESTARELHLEALLAEYNTLREETLAVEREIHEISMSALAATAGIATLVVALVNTSPELLASVLLILPFPFAALMLSYLGHVNALSNLGQYIASYIEPSVNQIINSATTTKVTASVLGWQRFQYTEVRGAVGWVSGGLWAVGQGLLIGLPIIGSMVAFYFTITYANLSVTGWWTTIVAFDFALIASILVLIVVAIYRYGFFRKSKQKK